MTNGKAACVVSLCVCVCEIYALKAIIAGVLVTYEYVLNVTVKDADFLSAMTV